MPTNLVYFSHGKESGPWGTKIQHLAKIARQKEFAVESPDYSFTMDADKRVAHLLTLDPRPAGKLILVGSSMGGYVAAVASQTLQPDALLLLAPAIAMPGYAIDNPPPKAALTHIVHAWQDEIVPVADSIRYAQKYSCELTVLNADHRLTSVLPQIEMVFSNLLDRTLAQ